MDVAVSRPGKWVLRGFFSLVVAFLYAPIVILLIFSFNNSDVPSFPLSGFTLHWYGQFLHNWDLHAALEASAIVAALSSLGAVVLGILASIALTRRHFRLKAGASALLLSPLVIPYIVFGVSLLLLFHTLGIPRSILTVVIGHIVITLPYTILVLMPRLQQIDVSLEEAAFDLGAGRLRTFRSITLPLILPAIMSAFLIAFTTSFDEYAVASFVVGSRTTFPIYLYSALRFPSQLPQVIAVAVVVILISLTVVVAAEVGRRAFERRVASDLEDGGVLGVPGDRDASAGLQRRQLLVGQAVGHDAAHGRLDVELRVHTEVDDLVRACRSDVIRRSARLPPGRPICTCSGRTAIRSESPCLTPASVGTMSRSPSPTRIIAKLPTSSSARRSSVFSEPMKSATNGVSGRS